MKFSAWLRDYEYPGLCSTTHAHMRLAYFGAWNVYHGHHVASQRKLSALLQAMADCGEHDVMVEYCNKMVEAIAIELKDEA